MPREQRPAYRVLIVDDEESTRLLLARLLNELHVESQLAGTCEQALRLAQAHTYDAILLDLMMPGIGGLEVLRQLRADSPNAATPVVVVSIVRDPAVMDQCMSAGANAYHVKPVRRAELQATVKAQLARHAKTTT